MHRPDIDLWEEVQLTNGFAPRVPAQLHFRRPNVWVFAQDDEHKSQFLELVQRRIDNGSVLKIPIRTAAERFCTTVRLVQHRRNDMFVRAANHDVGKDFLGRLPSLWNEMKDRLAQQMSIDTIQSPQVFVHLSVSFDEVYRAVAKIAFNYLAVRKGTAFARRSEFDPVRQYILGDIRHAPLRTADEVAIDGRFVSALKRGEQFLVPTSRHLVMLGYSYPNVFATVTLYGQHTFVVYLGEVEFKSIMDFLPEAHEFSIDGTSHRALDMSDIVRRIRGEASHDGADHNVTRAAHASDYRDV
jgi:hypothetical protein